MSALPSNLPDIAKAKLPATYEAAKNALAQCSEIDECKDWADKAEALASYAKQAKDEQLRQMADRIQARAIRRCGELLKQVDARGDHMKKDGAVLSQRQAAQDAGLSERQRKTAVRVANVPAEQFEEQVESAAPPSVTALAKQGTEPRKLVDWGDRDPADVSFATAGQGHLKRLADFAKNVDAACVWRGSMPAERQVIRKQIAIIDGWLDRLATQPEG